LKARLSEYLHAVRRGRTVTVLDRGTPVARLVPVAQTSPHLAVRAPRSGAPRPGDVRIPAAPKLDVDVVDYLLQERGER
jgi:antitoxin (DNA-binding transcriptional repressor) of toxin-antitoxin stability system